MATPTGEENTWTKAYDDARPCPAQDHHDDLSGAQCDEDRGPRTGNPMDKCEGQPDSGNRGDDDEVLDDLEPRSSGILRRTARTGQRMKFSPW